MSKLDQDQAIDIAYTIFLETASDNLSEADINLFNQKFNQDGSIEIFATADNWDEEIGVLIDADEYTEIWIGLSSQDDIMTTIFAKILIANDSEDRQYHIIWK